MGITKYVKSQKKVTPNLIEVTPAFFVTNQTVNISLKDKSTTKKIK
jgi:hypothetical protein